MSEEFVSSGGIRVKATDVKIGEGDLMVRSGLDADWRVPGQARNGKFAVNSALGQAISEFYQHRKDERLGRWRPTPDSNFVVYVVGDRKDGTVRVVDEADGVGVTIHEVWLTRDVDGYGVAAKAFFDAHPVRQEPWRNAKLGEVWVIREGDEEKAYLVDDGQFYDSSRDYALDFNDKAIVSARRIWPEDSE